MNSHRVTTPSRLSSRPRRQAHPLAGLWHARGGPAAALTLVAAVVATVAFPELSLPVTVSYGLPPRGIGTPELVGVLVAAVLPTLTTPAFDGRELHAARPARVAHLAVTGLVLLAPLAVPASWYAIITTTHPETRFPGLTGMLGTVAILTAVAVILRLTLGAVASTVGTVACFAGLVCAQQAAPTSFWATHLPTGRDWHTDYQLVAAAEVLALLLAWALRAVPLTQRPGAWHHGIRLVLLRR
jgi:hypothetical protein